MGIPQWLPLLNPSNQKIEQQKSDFVLISYDSSDSFPALSGQYEDIFHDLQGHGLRFDEQGDRGGSSFAVRYQGSFCLVSAKNATPVHVTVVCGPSKDQPEEKPQPLPAGFHKVEYVIDGDCGAAGLTYRNAGGGTEQRDYKLPVVVSFAGTKGSFLYISAQKKGEDGVLRVRIRVDGVFVRESISTSAYGIASASGRL